jgi:hypothetical protein
MSSFTPPRPEARIELPPTTRPMTLQVQPQYEAGSPLNALTSSPVGNPGWYRVTFVFAQPGLEVIAGRVAVDDVLKSGNSQIIVGTDHIRIYTGDPAIESANVHAKDGGRVTHAEVRINGASFADVESRSHALVGRIASFLSVLTALPLLVKFVHIREEVTESFQVTYVAIGRSDISKLKWDTMPDLNISAISAELMVAFGNFREGMNSLNAFYKLLSFYKVVDYCLAKDKQDKRKRRPVPPQSPVPTVLDDIDKDDVEAIRPYSGKSYTDVLDEFEGRIRNAIAHLSPDSTTVNPDDYEDIKLCSAAIPVLQLIARTMLVARYTLEASTATSGKS